MEIDITVIIWMFMLGAAVAMVIVYYNSRFLGKFVRALIQIDATSPESAISAEELGIKLSPALKYSLRPGTSFSQTVLKTEDGRYFIAPDKLSMARVKYRGKDTTIVFVLLGILLLGLTALALGAIFPDMLTRVIGQFSSLFGE